MEWNLSRGARISIRRRPTRPWGGSALVESLERRQLLAATPTATSLVASGTAIALGQTLTLTATVAVGATRVGDGGVVTFRDGVTVLGSAPVVDGTATLSTATLAAGRHDLSARFGGTVSLAPSDTGLLSSSLYQTVAGTGVGATDGDGGPATSAGFYRLQFVRADRAGNLYVATNDFLIRKIAPNGTITTVAGSGQPGYSGDGGPATNANITVDSMTVDGQGNILIGDAWDRVVRKITPGGIITTVVGVGEPPIGGTLPSGATPTYPMPNRLAVDGSGNIYIADGAAGQVTRVTPSGDRQVIAGSGERNSLSLPTYTDPADGTSALSAGLGNIDEIVADHAGHVFIASADVMGVHFAVREVDPDGTIRTVFVDNTPPPYGFVSLSLDDAGNLFIAVPYESRVYEVRPDGTSSIVAGQFTPAPPVTSPRVPYAGDGQVAQGNAPGTLGSIAAVPSGGLVYLDPELNVIREITGGVVVTVAPDPTAAVRFVVTPAASNVTAGQPLSFVVTAVNSAGQTVTDYTGTVHFRSNVGSADLPADVALLGGTGSFTATFRKATDATNLGTAWASRRITVTDGAGLSGTSAGFSVSPAAAARFVFIGPAQVVDSQGGLGPEVRFTVQPVDAFGNPLYRYNLNYEVSGQAAGDFINKATAPWGEGPITLDGSPVQFDFGYRGYGVGPRTLVVSDRNDPTVTGSISFEVVAALTTGPWGPEATPFSDAIAPTTWTIDGPSSVVAGERTVYGLTVRDAFGNPLTSFNGTVSAESSDTQADLPTSVEVRNGQASFTATLRKAGAQTIRVKSPDANSVIATSSVVVRANKAVQLDTRALPQANPGDPVTLVVTAYDIYGNVATDYNDRITLGIDELTTSVDGDALQVNPTELDLRQGVGRINLLFPTSGYKSIQVNDLDHPELTGSGVLNVGFSYAARPGSQFPILGSVTGVLYVDRFGNNIRDTQESGLAGQVVYEDVNGNGVLDPGEPTSITDANGVFRFSAPPPGTQPTIRVLADGVRAEPLRPLRDGTVTLGLIPTDPAGGVDASTAYVRALYRSVLGRSGSTAEVAAWVQQLNQGASRADVADRFLNSDENRVRQVAALYQTIFGRDLDPFARSWVDALGAGMPVADVAAALLGSDEYRVRHKDDAQFAQGLYQDVLGRAGDPVGLANLQRQLAFGATRASVAREVLNSDEAVDHAIDEFYLTDLRRAADPAASAWKSVFRSSPHGETLAARGILASDEFVQLSQKAIV